MTHRLADHEWHRIKARAKIYRSTSASFREWAKGYGVIAHDDLTQVRVYEMADALTQRGAIVSKDAAYAILKALDRVASAGMWLVTHMTYARTVQIEGGALAGADFKKNPEGHTGGSLNMVLGYAGYLAANALSGITRSWLMGQGHCVAAIDAINLVVGNMSPEQAERYAFSNSGLTCFVRDFYSYEVDAGGRPVSPLGSHVNPLTAGGMIEGGYLGFAELLYVHMPLPGESLVAFLSDGAFEEQRASDWAPRWWRAEDCGLVAPIMIANGRRIDQRSTIAQKGGVDWFRKHLRLNGFDPIDLDGRDPAAFAWAILQIEERLKSCGQAVRGGSGGYPVPLHYGIAEVPKGFGLPGAGTNRAHNLPLKGNPATLKAARMEFNTAAKRLWVSPKDLKAAVRHLNTHNNQGRPREKDHPLITRPTPKPKLPEPPWMKKSGAAQTSPMAGIDQYFTKIVKANPNLRPRVGNPDEMRSNRMNKTLDLLQHRVLTSEDGVAEDVSGGVITALNEEAVVCAALGNKGGLNLVVSYEAFAVKMLGAIRQEVIFARHQKETGRKPNWLGVPILLTSHVWENGKNEQSHQDPTLAEALLGEMSDTARVLFPADWNSAVSALRDVYQSYGQISALITPKRPMPFTFSAEQASCLIQHGALRVSGTGAKNEKIILTAIGGYQLAETLRASRRLTKKGLAHTVVYMLEPGRFREPRDAYEAAFCVPSEIREKLFPESAGVRVFIGHCRPEPLQGVLRPLDTGRRITRVLGFKNRGGTLDTPGMLFANGCTWAHILAAVAESSGCPVSDILEREEIEAIQGETQPREILF